MGGRSHLLRHTDPKPVDQALAYGSSFNPRDRGEVPLQFLASQAELLLAATVDAVPVLRITGQPVANALSHRLIEVITELIVHSPHGPLMSPHRSKSTRVLRRRPVPRSLAASTSPFRDGRSFAGASPARASVRSGKSNLY